MVEFVEKMEKLEKKLTEMKTLNNLVNKLQKGFRKEIVIEEGIYYDYSISTKTHSIAEGSFSDVKRILQYELKYI